MTQIYELKPLDEPDFLRLHIGAHQEAVDRALNELRAAHIMERIWTGDHTVWKPDPTEITNRLGWLRIADVLRENLTSLLSFVDSVRADGYTQALLLGMGGSSLAPEVFRKTFGVKTGYLDLAVLDSTDPGPVLAFDQKLNLTKTLFIVATKSGGTAETLSAFKYFYNRLAATLSSDAAGAHFIAITDPGSSLVDLAKKYGFRAVFLNDPNIGGRYSALSYFGIVPAALLGVDLETLLNRAKRMERLCASVYNNPAAVLGAVLGELAKVGRDKVTFIVSPAIASFGDWVEQLIAESTGKEGKGILPVVGETIGQPGQYGNDRLFVYLRLDNTHDSAIQTLEQAGQPVVWLPWADLYDLGGQFFLWEMATAVAGHRLGIQPFDQPNVEAAKVIARQMIAAYQKEGRLPALDPLLIAGDITVYGDIKVKTLDEAWLSFLNEADSGDYVALQAYVNPTPATDAALADLRARIRNRLHRATTAGYGPRFLHSTGQLHKGDSGNGLFIQFTADAVQDVDIPDEAGKPESTMTFNTLKLAQAMGDRQALLDNGRRVLRFHLGTDVVGGLQRLLAALG